MQDSLSRSYILYVPGAYDGQEAWPLVINYHGFSDSAKNQMERHSKMNAISDTAHFLVAYPQGLQVENLTPAGAGLPRVAGGWNIPGIFKAEQNDVAFTGSLIDTLQREFKVDSSKIHVTGWSNGSLMAFQAAYTLQDRIASVAGVSGMMSYSMIDSIKVTRPFSTLSMHGNNDPILSFDGIENYWPSASTTPSFWASHNGCSTDSIVTELPNIDLFDGGTTVTRIKYTGCDDNAEVLFYRINNGGHGWPGNTPSSPLLGSTNKDIIASSEIWNFFKRNPLPEMSPRFVSPVPPGAQVEHVVGAIDFAEGPLWHPDSSFLLCSDLDGNRIFKIDPKTRTKEVYLSPSGGANGLAFDLERRLIMCQLNERSLARLEPDSSITVLASHYDGKRFNSPNDVVVKSDGTIFFTDPTFTGSPQPQELNFDGIYAISNNGELKSLEKTVSGPNGIVLSPDEKKLYVNEARNLVIYVFDLENDLTLTNKRIFARMSGANYLDGMKVDENGLLFCAAGNSGIWIFSPDGEFLDRIAVPGNVTNLNWGDEDGQALYITQYSRKSGGAANVYRIRLNTTGFVSDVAYRETSVPTGFKLLQNFPNPFNPATTITYNLLSASNVELKIYNSLGQEIRTLVDSAQPAGTHQAIWDGRDNRGNWVPSGVYFYKIRAGAFVQTRKMLLIR